MLLLQGFLRLCPDWLTCEPWGISESMCLCVGFCGCWCPPIRLPSLWSLHSLMWSAQPSVYCAAYYSKMESLQARGRNSHSEHTGETSVPRR